MNIYVANINFKATNEDLKQVFEAYGEVSSARIIMDKMSGRSRGFGFVEMPNDDHAREAIEKLNGYVMMDKTLSVNEARPKTDDYKGGGNRSSGGGHYNRDGGGYNKRY
jgi:RNA recognition motif-containing protein